MTKTDQLIQMIVDIVSQDYEPFQLIEKELADWAGEKGMQFSETEFQNALASAVQDGLIQVFRYETALGKFELVSWDFLAPHGFYYLATKRGRTTLQ